MVGDTYGRELGSLIDLVRSDVDEQVVVTPADIWERFVDGRPEMVSGGETNTRVETACGGSLWPSPESHSVFHSLNGHIAPRD